ncbi:methylated-DNA--[protein]-cysteine S-methyltransferase [Actinocorallia populi]|uniref:methylated-DNA--[protein]-cysteine S-methyltransferase n=1 Tax=Actinocorallia populi TaxID=2079200 RepID=UPI0018E53451|nr:methylated-DNA--[protein]-cysteine S-methyltransferase [Actinocorallia populi]
MTLYTTFDSPLGTLLLTGVRTGTGLALASLSLPGQRNAPVRDDTWRHAPADFTEAVSQLDAYFSGGLKEFDLPFATTGTPFQRQVWAALEALPYGATTTYGELNAALGGTPARVRAIGGAIGANPLLIVRPCHRVIGSTGSLTGYAGGLPAKQALLTLEGALLAAP